LLETIIIKGENVIRIIEIFTSHVIVTKC
jgi:hypothetical protein